MKKSLLTLALVALTTVASYAQGTIAFGNSALTRVQVIVPGTPARNAVVGDNLMVGAFFGPAGAAADALALAPGTASISPTTAGVLANAPSVFGLPGTEGGQVVSLQIRAWDASKGADGWRTGIYGQTTVAQVTLGPTAGPGTVVWQTATGTFTTRFTPLIVTIPEPSTIALAVLGLGSLLLFRRRK
jgi:hypothetical protein